MALLSFTFRSLRTNKKSAEVQVGTKARLNMDLSQIEVFFSVSEYRCQYRGHKRAVGERDVLPVISEYSLEGL